jgi:hypothetical protein
MKYFLNLRTTYPIADSLALAALAALLLKLLLLNRYPAAASLIADLGTLTESILSSIIASYVFYFFTIHLKEIKDKSNIAPYIEKHCKRIVESCRHQLIAISRSSGVSITLETASHETINKAFAQLSPYGEAPMIIGENTKANWLQYFESHMQSDRRSLSRLLLQLPNINTELIAILFAIDDCSHFEVIDLTKGKNFSNPNLGAWTAFFTRYVELCKDLDSFVCSQSGKHSIQD